MEVAVNAPVNHLDQERVHGGPLFVALLDRRRGRQSGFARDSFECSDDVLGWRACGLSIVNDVADEALHVALDVGVARNV
jgi:hypothetical protein